VTFDAIFVPAELRAAVSDRAWVVGMLDAERALANAGALAGVVPAHLAGSIAEACRIELFDVAAIVEDGRSSGNPAEPLVRALRAAVGGEAAMFVHFGATSQDIVDSAAMLVASRSLALIIGELDGVASACAQLAEEHRLTPMSARTLLQQAVPTTFGAKSAGWLVAIVTARNRLASIRETGLAAQLGGAAGTLAAFGSSGLDVAARYALELELPEPVVPWHTDRTRIAELGAALAVAAGVAAKIGLDVALLEQTEVAEISEPAGAGGSSAMPHKRNPVGSALAVACARQVQAAAGVLCAGLVQEHERAVGAWHAEWGALSIALAYAGGGAAAVRGSLEGLSVDAARMLSNLELTGGAVMSERLAGLIGRDETNQLLAQAASSGRTLREELAADPPAGLVAGALDPASYLGESGALVDRALAFYREER